MNHQIRLKSRPTGEPTAANFERADAPVPQAGDGDVLRRTIYLSLDPYMRGRMSDAKSYATPVKIGDVMGGHTVSEVIESRNPDFKKGDFVTGYDGWQSYGVSAGKELRKLDPKAVPISTAIGVLGMPGMTAFVGLMDIGQPKAGRDGRRLRRVGRGWSGRRSAREDQGMPRGRRRRVARQVQVRRRGARVRRVHQLQDRRPRAGAEGGVSRRGRHLFRERRRRAVRGDPARHQQRGAHPAVRRHLGVQRDREHAGSEPAAAAGQPRDDQGVHRQRSHRIARRRSCRRSRHWSCRAASSSARTSSTDSTTPRTRSSGCCTGRTSAS